MATCRVGISYLDLSISLLSPIPLHALLTPFPSIVQMSQPIGRVVTVRTNAFEITKLPDKIFYHYDGLLKLSIIHCIGLMSHALFFTSSW